MMYSNNSSIEPILPNYSIQCNEKCGISCYSNTIVIIAIIICVMLIWSISNIVCSTRPMVIYECSYIIVFFITFCL